MCAGGSEEVEQWASAFTCLFKQERAATCQSEACFLLQGKSEKLAEVPKAGPGSASIGSPLRALHGVLEHRTRLLSSYEQRPQGGDWVGDVCSLPTSVQRSTTSEPLWGEGRREGDSETSQASPGLASRALRPETYTLSPPLGVGGFLGQRTCMPRGEVTKPRH